MLINKTLTVSYPNGQYPLIIGNGLLKEPALLRRYVNGQQAMIVSNTTVAKLYLDSIEKALQDSKDNVPVQEGDLNIL